MRAWEQEQHDALLDGGLALVVACPVCTGDEDADPCGEDCERIMIRAARARQITRLFAAARKALYNARQYRLEGDGRSSRRVRDCIDIVAHYRREIRICRLLMTTPVEGDLAEAAQ